MSDTKLPVAVCKAIPEVIHGSHSFLDELYISCGAPEPPPDLSHHSKWSTWLQRCSNDSDVDSLGIAGKIIEEFMDVPPLPPIGDQPDEHIKKYKVEKDWLNNIFEQHGLRYFRGGRLLPNQEIGEQNTSIPNEHFLNEEEGRKPSKIEDLLETLVKGLPRAMYPLTYRRKGSQNLVFESEYDIQDLLHSQLRPWIQDIRPEEFTPSYGGTSTRMDFLLPKYKFVIETKRVRDKSHAKKITDELIIDIEHYRTHEKCEFLWCVIYDQSKLILNPSGIIQDLEGPRKTPNGHVQVRVFTI